MGWGPPNEPTVYGLMMDYYLIVPRWGLVLVIAVVD